MQQILQCVTWPLLSRWDGHPVYSLLASLQRCNRQFRASFFKGLSLVSEKTDETLHSLKDCRATLKFLGIYTPAGKWKAFRPPQSQNFQRFAPWVQELPRRRNRGYQRCSALPSASAVLVPQGRWYLPRAHFDGQVKGSLSVLRVTSFSFPIFANCLSHIYCVGPTSPQIGVF